MSRKSPRVLRILRVRYRRAVARVDRNTPEWLQWLTPWGSSIAFHALALVLMGLWVVSSSGDKVEQKIQADFPQQLVDDLTSLKPADQTGDPFTKENTPEPPSLTLDPAQVDNTVTSLPELPPSFKLGPELQLSSPIASGATLGASAEGTGSAMSTKDLSAPFSGRGAAVRAKIVRREGGSVFSEKAVERGLDWLARHQREDGGWGLDPKPVCKGAGCPPSPSVGSDAAAVGLALLPLLGAGQTHTEPGRYQKTMQRGIDWLVKHQQPDGDLWVSGQAAQMYTHAIATMALCEAYGVSRDENLKEPAQKALDFIEAARNKEYGGGWRYTPGEAGDTSVFGWQMFALRSGALSGLRVSGVTVKACRDYLDRAATDSGKSLYAYQPGMGFTPVMTAEALLSRQYLGWHRDHPAMIQGVEKVVEDLRKTEERNIYYWYYATQLLHNMEGPAWVEWNQTVRDGLIGLQVGGRGCDRGSWDALRPKEDSWGKTAGRHFTTALSLLTLEVYYRYLPIYRERGRDADEATTAENAVRDAAKKKSARGATAAKANNKEK